MPGTFHCTLVTPEEQIIDESVAYASIPAHDGQVGIERSRAPLLIRLGDGALRLDFTDGGSRWFFVGGGFAQMKDNRLSLVADEAIPAEDIVRQDAEAAMAEAEAIRPRMDEQIERRLRLMDRARGLLVMHDKLGNKL